MANSLPVKQGISSGAIRNIPEKWSPAWFRAFITHHLQNADYRNAIAGPGIVITGTEQQPGTISTGGAAVAVANLPAPAIGNRAMVSNSNVVATGNFGNIVAGGGASIVPVYYDGVNWRIG